MAEVVDYRGDTALFPDMALEEQRGEGGSNDATVAGRDKNDGELCDFIEGVQGEDGLLGWG